MYPAYLRLARQVFTHMIGARGFGKMRHISCVRPFIVFTPTLHRYMYSTNQNAAAPAKKEGSAHGDNTAQELKPEETERDDP